MANAFLRECIENAYDAVVSDNITYNTSISFDDLVNKQMRSYQRQIEQNIFQQSPLMEAIKKEREMSDTEKAVAEARKKATEAKVAETFAEVSDYFDRDFTEGAIVTAQVVFRDSDKTYQYVWVLGAKGQWFRTYSTDVLTVDDVVDELTRLMVDAVSVAYTVV